MIERVENTPATSLTVIPAKARVKELASRPATSPRLRGEVGICASERGFRVRGNATSSDCGALCNVQQAPHPDPLPASGARGNKAGIHPPKAGPVGYGRNDDYLVEGHFPQRAI
jgi:hypothetical protein